MADTGVEKKVQRIVRRQAAAASTRSYVLSLPHFQAVEDIPQHMLDMLDRLAKAEGANN